MRRLFKFIKNIIIIAVLAYISYSIFTYVSRDELLQEPIIEPSVGVTLEEIKRIAELSSVEYLMEARMIIEKPKDRIWIFDIPQTDKYYIAMAQGKVRAGIDLGEIEIISCTGEEVRLKLPRAKILDSYIDPKTKWEKEFERLFAKITAEEVTQAQINAEEDMVKRALENGILDNADENAKVIIQEFLKLSGVKLVIFE